MGEDYKEAGFSAKDSKKAGWFHQPQRPLATVTDCEEAGFSAASCKEAGVSAEDCKEAGFSAASCKEAGFSAEDCKEAGFSAKDSKKAGWFHQPLGRKLAKSIRSRAQWFAKTCLQNLRRQAASPSAAKETE